MKHQRISKNVLLALFLLCSPFLCADDKKETAPTEQTQATPLSPQTPTESPVTPSQGPAPLPSSEEMTHSYESAFVQMIATLLGILLLVFATFWILRRLGGGKFKSGSGQGIRIIEKKALSPKSILYIVEIGGKKVLISESQAEVRALTVVERSPETSE